MYIYVELQTHRGEHLASMLGGGGGGGGGANRQAQVRPTVTCRGHAQPILAGTCKKRDIKQDHQDQCDISQHNAGRPGKHESGRST